MTENIGMTNSEVARLKRAMRPGVHRTRHVPEAAGHLETLYIQSGSKKEPLRWVFDEALAGRLVPREDAPYFDDVKRGNLMYNAATLLGTDTDNHAIKGRFGIIFGPNYTIGKSPKDFASIFTDDPNLRLGVATGAGIESNEVYVEHGDLRDVKKHGYDGADLTKEPNEFKVTGVLNDNTDSDADESEMWKTIRKDFAELRESDDPHDIAVYNLFSTEDCLASFTAGLQHYGVTDTDELEREKRGDPLFLGLGLDVTDIIDEAEENLESREKAWKVLERMRGSALHTVTLTLQNDGVPSELVYREGGFRDIASKYFDCFTDDGPDSPARPVAPRPITPRDHSSTNRTSSTRKPYRSLIGTTEDPVSADDEPEFGWDRDEPTGPETVGVGSSRWPEPDDQTDWDDDWEENHWGRHGKKYIWAGIGVTALGALATGVMAYRWFRGDGDGSDVVDSARGVYEAGRSVIGGNSTTDTVGIVGNGTTEQGTSLEVPRRR